MKVCLFVYCNGACKSGLFSKKQNSNGTLQLDTRGFNAAFSHWIPKCVNWTDLERPTESVSVEELKTSLTFYLWTNCLREFRYLMNESSID